MRTRVALLALISLLLLALAACGGSAEPAEESGQEPASSENGEEDQSSPEAGDVDYSDVLTPADVEGVTGMTGLAVIAPDPSVGAGGEVNIVDESGEMVVMVDVAPGLWDGWQADGMTVGRPSDPTIGDESFLGPKDTADEDAYILGFRKGDTGAAVVAFFSIGFERTLTLDEMYELAEIVESRL